MKAFAKFTLIAAACVVGSCLVGASSAHALSGRTFLATTGSDSNPCTASQPCRTLNVALAATAEKGTIVIVDSGGFGNNQTINKSVRVIADPGITAEFVGTYAALLINGTGIDVELKGLRLKALGYNTTSLFFSSGARLSVNDLTITSDGEGGFGILHQAAGGVMTVHRTAISRMTTCAEAIGTSQGIARMTITDSEATDCSYGVFAYFYSQIWAQRVAVTGTLYSSCFLASGGGLIHVDASLGANCGVSVNSPGSKMTISNSMIQNGGSVSNSGLGYSLGNNSVGDTGNVAFSGFTIVTPQ